MSEEAIHLFNIKVIDAQPMTGDITSSSLNVQEAISFAVQAFWENGTTPIGKLDLQASNDNSHFTSVLPSAIDISGDADSLMINVEKHAYGYVRVVYTRTSGNGTLTVQINAKAE